HIPQSRWNPLYYQAPSCGSFYWLCLPVPKGNQYLIQRESHQDQCPVARHSVRRKTSRHKLKVLKRINVAGEIFKVAGESGAGKTFRVAGESGAGKICKVAGESGAGKIFKVAGESGAGKIFKADGARGVGKIF
ncbi:hypothetical protein Cfor_08152, partial [Coptotermes formosanus]